MEGNFSQVYVHQTKEPFSAMKSYDTVAVDRFRRMEEDYHNGRRGGGTPQSFWRGCVVQTSKPYFRPKSVISIPFFRPE